MVALAPITNETHAWDVLNAFPKLHSRAREVKTTPCTEVPLHKSRSRIEIWLTICETCDRLESFTRDPIGFEGSEWDLYEYCFSSPAAFTDPDGMMIWVIPAIPVVAGGGSAAAAAAAKAAIAAAGSIGIAACFKDPACRARVEKAINDALAGISASARAALILACDAAYVAYKALPSCERCIRGYADNCWFAMYRCAHATKNLACHSAVAIARSSYIISGCDVVSPPKEKDHMEAAEQAFNGAERCRESMENNCFGDHGFPILA